MRVIIEPDPAHVSLRVAELMAQLAPRLGAWYLAGPQIGVMQRIFVMDVTWKEGDPSPMVCINPEITNASDARFGLLGARFVGEETLNRFYVLHCIAIPLGVALLIAIHFWRVRKDGGISQPL